jgi:hypothetical protein
MAWDLFLEFAVAVGAISKDEQLEIWSNAWVGLVDTAFEQAVHQVGEDPSGKFVRLVSASIVSGRAHVTKEDGGPPADPELFGWRLSSSDSPRLEPRGDRIGWMVDDELYLDPDVSFAVAESFARAQGESLCVTKDTLWRRLRDSKLLASVDTGLSRGRNLVRKTIENTRPYVLHVVRERFVPSVVISGPIGPEEPKVFESDDDIERGEL